HEALARALAKKFASPTLAAPRVYYHSPQRRMLHDVLRCIDRGVRLEQARAALLPNDTFALPSRQRIREVWEDDIASVRRTRGVAMRCKFDPLALTLPMPDVALAPGETPRETLRRKVSLGVSRRYGASPPERVRRQVEHELALISSLDYEGYFLAMAEIVEFCVREGILCQGRGSAANSVVCYCLGVTAIDPLELGLLFERFLSGARTDPPDIDLDVMHQRREEVIRFIYSRHGGEHAAMLCNIVRFRRKLALREVGKVLGFPEDVLGKVGKMIGRGAVVDRELLSRVHLNPEARRVKLWLALAAQLEGTPRHLSIHPGGFLISREPIRAFVPVQDAAMEGRTIIQWDKYDVEVLGLFKVDILGLGALSMLDHALKLLGEQRGEEVGLADLPVEDAETYEMLSRGDSLGVFQLESRAQVAMLPRLKPRCFYDLVIEVSLVRPGPIQGQMVKPYLDRRRGLEPVVHAHPSLEEVLGKTLGVPIFQEQVMRVAMVAAGYSAAEADRLRKDLGSWRVSETLRYHRARLLSGMAERGIGKDFAERICQQLEGFASYGFPESHAASFALIAYATAYLRCHHPAVFACALLRAQPMGFYNANTIIADGKRRGVRFLPPDVTSSDWDHDILADREHPHGKHIRLGLRMVKGVVEEEMLRLIEERARAPFRSVEGVIRRARLGKKSALALARADAFAGLGLERRAASWAARGGLARRDDRLRRPDSPRLPSPQPAQLELFEQIERDIEATSISLQAHPLAPWRERLQREGVWSTERAKRTQSAGAKGTRVTVAGLVIRRQRPQTARGVLFITLEDEFGLLDVIVEPDVYEAHRFLIKGNGALAITGVPRCDEARVWLQATSLAALSFADFLPNVRSVDFR
ncbi:MAG: error-prone DNA polymerase, partial [Myxococcota bacterium]|nr:error-prone DNA polymerase [Myxococcota bacterium]